jgi:hypothetical protein
MVTETVTTTGMDITAAAIGAHRREAGAFVGADRRAVVLVEAVLQVAAASVGADRRAVVLVEAVLQVVASPVAERAAVVRVACAIELSADLPRTIPLSR